MHSKLKELRRPYFIEDSKRN